MTLLGYLRIKHHLSDPGPIPQVDEYQLAVVAAPVYPACQRYLSTCQVLFQFATIMGL
jgi:hypothetical protein